MGNTEKAVLEALDGLSTDKVLDVLSKVLVNVVGPMGESRDIEKAMDAIDNAMHVVIPSIGRSLMALDTPSESMRAWILCSSEFVVSVCSTIVSLSSLSSSDKRLVLESLPDIYRDVLKMNFDKVIRGLFCVGDE